MLALPRIRLVWRRRRSNLRPFVAASIAVHVIVTVGLVVAPMLFGRKRTPLDSFAVDLVAAPGAASTAPEPAAAAPPPPPSPPPPTEPPEGVRAEPKEPPKPKDEPKKKEPEKKQPAPPPPPPPPKETAPAGPPGSATGAAATTGDKTGSVSAMEAGDFELGWYRDSVTSALYRQWVKPVLENVGEAYQVSVTFDILRDGRVSDLRIEQSSGIATLDRSALRAVSDAAPLPPLPPAWGKPSLSVRFLFRLHPE